MISRTERSPAASKTSRDERLGRLGVEVGGRLVEDEHRRVREQRPGDDEALTLTAGELRSLLAHERVEPVGERRDPVGEPRTPKRVVELVVGRVRAREAEVLADRRVEDVRLLPGERERAPDVLLAQLARRRGPPIVDAARLGIEEAQEEVRDGRLPRAARPDERDPPARLEPQVDAVQSARLVRRVASGHALERDGDAARSAPGRGSPGRAIAGVAVGQLEDAPRRRRASPKARARPPAAARRRRTTPARAARASPRARGRASRRRAPRRRPRARRRRVRPATRTESRSASPATSASRRPRRASSRRRADAREGVVLPAVGDELGRAAQELDELGGRARPLRGGLAPARAARQPRRRAAARRRRRARGRRASTTRGGGQDDARSRRRMPRRPRARRAAARARGRRAPGARRRRRPCGSSELAAPVALELAPARAARCARRSARGSGRARAARGRARRGARGSGRAAARAPKKRTSDDRHRQRRGSAAARRRAR